MQYPDSIGLPVGPVAVQSDLPECCTHARIAIAPGKPSRLIGHTVHDAMRKDGAVGGILHPAGEQIIYSSLQQIITFGIGFLVAEHPQDRWDTVCEAEVDFWCASLRVAGFPG